ncbi:MAG TPA: glycosyltransferase family 2 protein, partial [Nitrospirota bacterium]
VASCRKLTYDNVRVMVIDNGSSDNSEKILRRSLPDIEVIQSGSNLGFAGGNNVGIRLALERGAEYIWLLNNDAVVDPAALSALVETAESDASIGIVGSKIFFFSPPRRIWFAGGFWKYGKLFFTIRGEEEDRGQYDRLEAVDFITGCSLLIRAETVRQIGLLDEKYFLYWEDAEWNARAGEHGWAIRFEPRSKVWHKVSSSFNPETDAQAYYYLRNKLLFYGQHAPAVLPIVFCLILLGALRHIFSGKFNFVCGYFSGMKDFFLGKFGKRREG